MIHFKRQTTFVTRYVKNVPLKKGNVFEAVARGREREKKEKKDMRAGEKKSLEPDCGLGNNQIAEKNGSKRAAINAFVLANALQLL